MPQQVANNLESNFSKGLITENNPLSFPENACTDADNCIFSITGEVTRRSGIDMELNYTSFGINCTNKALANYQWNNAGGDGVNQMYVQQVGSTILFYLSSAANLSQPLSVQKIANTVDLTAYVPSGSFDSTIECQFSDGNGYLFIFHPSIDPVYCTYFGGIITPAKITVKIRDTVGIFEPGVADNLRPAALSDVHKYNLQNQGWTQGSPWTATALNTLTSDPGSKSFTVQTGLPIIVSSIVALTGQSILPPFLFGHLIGSVTSYNSGTGALVINCTATDTPGDIFTNWSIVATNFSLIGIWNTQVSGYPSNADVWWRFKDNTGAFNPSALISQVTLDTNSSPKGSYILNAFNQQRYISASIPGLIDVTTTKRPKTGTWFQGRVWYAGVDASFPPTGEEPFSSWTETIYFSQVIEQVAQLGYCYQKNDPTSQTFFDLLATDGGTIRIQGCGSIHKLFSIQNGLLVFASNGIWFITGSQGIGFSANDYTITKISAVQTVSGTSFVNVQGYPMFWNTEGIWAVSPSTQGGGLVVENLCLGTILSYYAGIPTPSKKTARGDYNPIDYVISWTFKSVDAANLTDSYRYDKVLSYNSYTKSFYTYSLPITANNYFISGIKYVPGLGGTNIPESMFKYLVVFANSSQISFAEERDTTSFTDFNSVASTNFLSYFVSGYKIHGQGMRKWQPIYINLFSTGEFPTFYKIQGIWNFANNANSGKYSSLQYVTNALTRFGVISRRHKIRGHGLALQFRVESVDGQPFDIHGWSVIESSNTGA